MSAVYHAEALIYFLQVVIKSLLTDYKVFFTYRVIIIQVHIHKPI